jgi:septation ring formation regulator EzrA
MCSPTANSEVLILRNNDKACRLLSFTIAMLTLGVSSASAAEQCRFIQAKPEREACYQRQEAELTSKRKVEPRRDKTMEALEQMKHEDEALDRQIHSICRGC